MHCLLLQTCQGDLKLDRSNTTIAQLDTSTCQFLRPPDTSDSDVGLDEFFGDIAYTLLETPDIIGAPLLQIRDSDDYLILYTAIIGQVDVLVTGDKDFFDVTVDRPEILSPIDFMAKY
jgi:hypothetical protein